MSVHQLRKNGEYKQAWEHAIRQVEEQPGNYKYVEELAWVYRDFLKREAEKGNLKNFLKVCNKISELTLHKGNKILNEQFAWSFYRMLKYQLKNVNNNHNDVQIIVKNYNIVVHTDVPSLPQSIIIKLLLKVKDHIPYFWNILPWTNKNLLREADRKEEEVNGKKIMPLNERVFYAYIKTLIVDAEKNNNLASEKLNGLIDMTFEEKLIKQFTFADYHLAKACIVLNRKKQAIMFAETFVKNNINKSWAWKLLAEAVDNNDKKLMFLSKAVTLEHNETYLIGVRKMMTNTLLQKEYQMAAAENVDIEIKTRNKNNWHIPERISKNKKSTWYQNPTDKNELKKIINDYSSKAVTMLFPKATQTYAIVMGGNTKIKFLLGETGQTFKIKLKTEVKTGNWFIITHINQKLLSCCKTVPPEKYPENVRKFKGKLNTNGNFGFVDDIYVSKYLLKINKLQQGKMYKGIAIFTTNKKTDKKGWKAIKINNG